MDLGSFENISFNFYYDPSLDSDLLDFIYRTKLKSDTVQNSQASLKGRLFLFPTISNAGKPVLNWKTKKLDPFWNRNESNSATAAFSTKHFVTLLNERKWAYQWNRYNEITGAWIPHYRIPINVESIKNLRHLRMDHRGISQVALDTLDKSHIPPEILGSLQALESLHLPTNIVYKDLSFLRRLKKLKTLQIRPPKGLPATEPGINKCFRLTKLILLGAPDNRTIRDISRLRKLKDVVIVTEKLEPVEYQDKIQSVLKGKNVTVVDVEGYQPELSFAFKNHIEEIRARFEKRQR